MAVVFAMGGGRAGRDWQVVVVQQGGGAVSSRMGPLAVAVVGTVQGAAGEHGGPTPDKCTISLAKGGGGAALYRPLSFVRHPCHGKAVFTTATLFFKTALTRPGAASQLRSHYSWHGTAASGPGLASQMGVPGARRDPHLALSLCTQPRMRVARRGCTCICWWSMACGGPVAALPLGDLPRQLTTEGGPCVLSFVPAPGEIEGRGDVTPGRRLQGGDGAPSDVRVGPTRPRSSGAAAGRRPTSVALRFQDGRVHTKDALSTAVLSCGCRVLQLGGSGGD
ncbi:hypothetical protein I4F81_005680 [Pyropia yezoensis]|uniref:Uncharacterized protein n=1 Tax=Pyropia yezoensis TaxID=2788 RepID=A0ACC3BZZ2_PYRYE|nr:hypothetical protein I4F81_005680 [Neopyropia yezoensis]